MIYDALNYGKQVSKIAKEHRENKEFENSKEFLSGIKKTDKLKPVITLTIYFGADEWDGPRSLKEMFEPIDEHLSEYVADYKPNLIIPREIDDFSKFATDFGKVMKFISVSKNKAECAKLKDDKMFENVDKETVHVINVCTGADLEEPEGKETVNMCEGLRLWREEERALARQEGLEEGRQEGRQEGIGVLVTTLHELGQAKEFIVETIMKKFSLSEEAAREYIR